MMEEMTKWKRQKENWALNLNGFFKPFSLPKIHLFFFFWKGLIKKSFVKCDFL